MQSTGKSLLRQTSGKSSFSKREIGSKLNLPLQNKSSCKVSYTKRCKLKPKSVKSIGSLLSKRRHSEFSCNLNRSISSNGKPVRRGMQKARDDKSNKQISSIKFLCGKSSALTRKGNGRNTNGDDRIQRIQKRRKKKKKNVEQDEACRLQRRARYLLIKMKLEQNLIDAYSGEGWKGQSREKIKPEKELQRARKQILKCKLGIRDAIRQLGLLSSEGHIEDTVISPDGSVFHEHIFCAKCKLRDAFPDNDIILCDGACNCAFHQKCLEPPLATENIPPGDQGWLCKFCECKIDILEAINAHLGTCFSINSNWQDVFREATTPPDGENASLDPEEDWPSDDPEDDDYDPEINEKVCSRSGMEESMSDDASSSSGLFWSSDEASSLSGIKKHDKANIFGSIINVNTDDTSDIEIMNGRRQRGDVDYKKLYDEMFGKGAQENEQLSEDEDWGPARRKRRRKESDAGTVATCNGGDESLKGEVASEDKKKVPSVSQDKKKLFRIPPNAVEKLRRVFAENELPSRAMKENLSKQLGISSEKVNKWFKNARYTALKIRKEGNTKECCSENMSKGSNVEVAKNQLADQAMLKSNSYFRASAMGVHVSKNLRICHRKNPKSITIPSKNHQKRSAGSLPTNVIEKLRAALSDNQLPSVSVKRNLSKQLGIPYYQVSMWFSNAMCSKRMDKVKSRSAFKKKTANRKQELPSCVNETSDREQLYLVVMERLLHLQDKIEKLKEVLSSCREKNNASLNKTKSGEQFVIYVPVAEVREKVI